MKHLTRYCSLFVCFVLLFVLFSVPVNAEKVDTKSIKIYQHNQIQSPAFADGYTGLAGFSFFPNDNVEDAIELPYSDAAVTTAVVLSNSANMYASCYDIIYADNSIMLDKGKNYKVTLGNFYHSILITAKSTQYYIRNIDFANVYIVYSDNTSTSINSSDITLTQQNNSPTFSVDFEFTPSKDVAKIMLIVRSRFTNFPSYTQNYVAEITSYYGEFNGDNKYQFSLEVESQEAGLLKSVIEWLKGIKNGITDLFDSIAELPQKIWEFISEGLKGLFVPSEDFIVEFKDKLDSMLEQKLGAVYQVIDITLGSWDDITANDETNTIDFPQVTIPLPNSNSFTFGGYEVRIVPIGMESIANTLKLVVGIVCTVLFINGLRKRYDEIMGVEQ